MVVFLLDSIESKIFAIFFAHILGNLDNSVE